MPSNDYRDLVPELDNPRLVQARSLSFREFGKAVQAVPMLAEIIDGWNTRLDEPFHGLTCDGNCRHGHFRLRKEGTPVADASRAAHRLLSALEDQARQKLRFSIEAREWRAWSNPEFLINDLGLRLEEQSEPVRHLIMDLISASLGPRGYSKAQGCMRTNAFLGEITQVQNIMNEWSYNFLLFGEPGDDTPWGWNLYGHHLCLNCFFLGDQMVVSPVFMGAEPNVIDKGPYAGTVLFKTQEEVGLALMQSLDRDQRQRAGPFDSVKDERMAPGRYHPADGLHLGGAFQDNRVVPYEGIKVSDLATAQKDKILEIAEAFHEVLPDGPRNAKLADIESHLDETYWCWIGGIGPDDPFYYRIQSPITMLEFDHHPGVWLTNAEPAKCHIHTVIRTPNGNDYGRDLLRQHYRQTHPGKTPGR